METVKKIVNAVKDAYLDASEWVSTHPHWTIWASLSLIAVAAAVF